ncbi:MAG: hypothetical protein KJ025_05630 [Burkholderiales bacterium]|nr:hypothetical protein [Burkholderiales bacterium]
MPETFESNPAAAQNSAVINPYALAELIVGRRIRWKESASAPKLLESILQTPYDELFDPKFEGPLYTGLKLNEKLQLERVRSPLLDIEPTADVNDLESPDALPAEIRKLADLRERYQTSDVGSIAVHRAEIAGQQLFLTLRLPDKERLRRMARVLSRDVVKAIAYDPSAQGSPADWTPPGATWGDAGDFFSEAAEFFDPIQGAVANCYYIAALSALAWAAPFRIQHLTRATGPNQQQFVNLIRFYKPDGNGALDKEIEVTDTVPLNGSGGFIYCRSSETGEIWPAVYEKAFAKLKTGTTTDHPDITATGWGDCVFATAQLNGGKRFYYDTASRSGDQLWDIVRSNSMGGRTFNPMTAWTYSSGDAAPKKVVYADANIVGSHCYTVLGWDYRNGQKYLILRNPWGNTEATAGALTGTTVLYDISWWRPITLATVDGTFGMEAGAFKTYFGGIGVAK